MPYDLCFDRAKIELNKPSISMVSVPSAREIKKNHKYFFAHDKKRIPLPLRSVVVSRVGKLNVYGKKYD